MKIFILKFIVVLNVFNKFISEKVIVIGGSGRVGGSSVRSLISQGIKVDVGGRDIKNWLEYKSRFDDKIFQNCEFIPVDIHEPVLLEQVIKNYDLVINTAGPFQGLRTPVALETSLKLGKQYIDVCDDIELSRVARSQYYQDLSRTYGGSAIISSGIWPGGSSLLAQRLLSDITSSYNKKQNVRTQQLTNTISSNDPSKPQSQSSSSRSGSSSTIVEIPENEIINRVTFSFFTAGSGGAGETILTATFLLLGENVLTYENGKPLYKVPATDSTMIDFGKTIGSREVVRLNLIECESCYTSSRIANVETFFGTAPSFWNTLFIAMARLTPQKILQNRHMMKTLAKISLPMVRLVDMFVGSKNGIRIDAYNKQDDKMIGTAVMVHDDLEAAVGDSIAAFTIPMLQGLVSPGVYFPEEVPNNEYRNQVLNTIIQSAIDYQITIS